MTTTTEELLLMHRIADALERIAKRLKPEAPPAESLQVDDLAPTDTIPFGQDADGWIEWDGKSAPPSHRRIEARLRGGIVVSGRAAEFAWDHQNGDGDIVAYRVVT